MRNFLILLGILIVSSVSAQKSKVTSGLVDFNNGKYLDCLHKMEEALKSNELKEKYKAKAYFYKGKAIVNIVSAASKAKDYSTLEKYNDFVFDTNEAFIEAWKLKSFDPKLERNIELEVEKSYSIVLQSAYTALSYKTYDLGLKYAELLIENSKILGKKDYRAHDVSGQMNMALQDYKRAEKELVKAKELASISASNPDMSLAYVYYRLALIERYYKRQDEFDYSFDENKTMKFINEGFDALEKSWASEKAAGLATAERQKNHDLIYTDLYSFKLDVYLNAPSLRSEAIPFFKEALKQNPDNSIWRLAYASLLEKDNKLEEAIEQYKTVVGKAPNNFQANLHIGATYVNQAVAHFKVANDTEDLELSVEKIASGNKLYAEAFPYLEKALELDPKNMEVINTLMQICINLERTEEYSKYKELKTKLQNGQ